MNGTTIFYVNANSFFFQEAAAVVLKLVLLSAEPKTMIQMGR